jgi:hypothetical protein
VTGGVQVDLAFKRNFSKQEEDRDVKSKRKDARATNAKSMRRLTTEYFQRALQATAAILALVLRSWKINRRPPVCRSS